MTNRKLHFGDPGVLVALLLTLLACSSPEDEQLGASGTVELVHVGDIQTTGSGEVVVDATYLFTNTTDHRIAFRGVGDFYPLGRMQYQDGPTRIDYNPHEGLTSGLDGGVATLPPGGEARFRVEVGRPDLPLTVGVGSWNASSPMPDTADWDWARSKPVVMNAVLQEQAAAEIARRDCFGTWSQREKIAPLVLTLRPNGDIDYSASCFGDSLRADGQWNRKGDTVHLSEALLGHEIFLLKEFDDEFALAPRGFEDDQGAWIFKKKRRGR